jgi:hypothetical protein
MALYLYYTKLKVGSKYLYLTWYTFKANGQCLKLFLEQNPLDFEEVDVLDFLKL